MSIWQVTVTETSRNRTSSITTLPTNENYMEAPFKVHWGGHYNITVQTDADDALVAGPVMYEAPPIPSPHQLKVEPTTNGTYTLFWMERQPYDDSNNPILKK